MLLCTCIYKFANAHTYTQSGVLPSAHVAALGLYMLFFLIEQEGIELSDIHAHSHTLQRHQFPFIFHFTLTVNITTA